MTRNANRYAAAMPQLVTRVDAGLVAALDELVTAGVIASRSDGVRIGLERLIDRHRRDEIGRQIVEGYLRQPQTEDEGGWTDDDSARMIAEEPW